MLMYMEISGVRLMPLMVMMNLGDFRYVQGSTCDINAEEYVAAINDMVSDHCYSSNYDQQNLMIRYQSCCFPDQLQLTHMMNFEF